MNNKTCPSCSASVRRQDMLCACGYDWTMDDCPGCDKRIPEGTLICPHCRYDLETGTAAPVKKKRKKEESGGGVAVAVAPPKEAVVVEEEPLPLDEFVEEKPKTNKPGGYMRSHVAALGNYTGNSETSDSNYIELYWPKDQ